jgi:hypothetical protein
MWCDRKEDQSQEIETLIQFIERLIRNQKDLPLEYAKVVDKYFWELV